MEGRAWFLLIANSIYPLSHGLGILFLAWLEHAFGVIMISIGATGSRD